MVLADEIAVNKALLACGAPISAMNVIRKHLSSIKGGRLAHLTRARVVSLVVSDIPGDNPAHVSSGPTVPDGSTRQDALRLVAQYRIALPQAAMDHLHSDKADAPDAGDPAFARNEVHVIASAHQSLVAAKSAAEHQGIKAVILSDCIEGESKDVARMHAAIARNIAAHDMPFARPVILLSGGETTVTLPADHAGKGGRNSEFALSLALAVAGMNVVCLAADTDGIDGSETNAGAFCDGTTTTRLLAVDADAQDFLIRKDSFSAFDRLGDLFITGPTGTNVNDFRAVAIF
jgi:hydroxypyruvate reductase